jgi:hypothetical protein
VLLTLAPPPGTPAGGADMFERFHDSSSFAVSAGAGTAAIIKSPAQTVPRVGRLPDVARAGMNWIRVWSAAIERRRFVILSLLCRPVSAAALFQQSVKGS